MTGQPPNVLGLAAVLAACALPAIPAAAQKSAAGEQIPAATMLHLDGPGALQPHTWRGYAEGRIFGGDEDLAYAGLGASIGLDSSWEAEVRAVLAGRKSLAISSKRVIDHGGNDVELLVRRQFPGRMPLSGQIGVSIADTPAQRDSFFTLGVSAQTPLGSRAVLVLNPRAIFIDSNTIVGIGIGTVVHITRAVHLVADWTPIVTGDNTRDTSTGDRKRRDVYGGAVRFSTQDGRVSLDLGYVNGTGRTTGASLTPGLGVSGAFYVSLRVSR